MLIRIYIRLRSFSHFNLLKKYEESREEDSNEWNLSWWYCRKAFSMDMIPPFICPPEFGTIGANFQHTLLCYNRFNHGSLNLCCLLSINLCNSLKVLCWVSRLFIYDFDSATPSISLLHSPRFFPFWLSYNYSNSPVPHLYTSVHILSSLPLQ